MSATIKATAFVVNVGIGPSPSNPDNQYVVGFIWGASDGNTTAVGGSSTTYISFSSHFKQADRLLRQAMASEILSVSDLMIDPDDIYIPFS